MVQLLQEEKKILNPIQWDHCSRATIHANRMGLIMVQINLIKFHRKIKKYPN